MTRAEILKHEILRQYRSVRAFALDMEIPYSTLVTALERGIEGMAYDTVIRICDKLCLNPVDFSSLERGAYLDEEGRAKILDLMDDFAQMDKYKCSAPKKAK